MDCLLQLGQTRARRLRGGIEPELLLTSVGVDAETSTAATALLHGQADLSAEREGERGAPRHAREIHQAAVAIDAAMERTLAVLG